MGDSGALDLHNIEDEECRLCEQRERPARLDYTARKATQMGMMFVPSK